MDEEGERMDLLEIRDRVLLATLPHVAFEGWSEAAIRAGIAECGLPEAEASLAFSDGAPEMIAHWAAWADRQMLQALQDREEASAGTTGEPAAASNGGTGDRIAAAVRARIEVNAPWREAVRRTLSYLALPTNAPLAARSTYATVDAIWYACGDTSTDIGFYSKRATLAAIYGATVLYWLEDPSDEFTDTWAFLDRRLEDAMRLPRLRRRAEEWVAGFTLPKLPMPWRRPASPGSASPGPGGDPGDV